jgi:hypothetical protein
LEPNGVLIQNYTSTENWVEDKDALGIDAQGSILLLSRPEPGRKVKFGNDAFTVRL